VESCLGTTYEISVGLSAVQSSFLKWHPGHESPDGVIDLSQDAEREWVEIELDRETQARQQRQDESWHLLRVAAELLRRERVAGCHRRPIDKSKGVEVCARNKGPGCVFRNLQRCGSLWVCPRCAARITEIRRAELQQCLENAKRRGWSVYLLTLTIPHHCGNDTAELCNGLLAAREKMRNRTGWRRWASSMGLIGSVRALETTYGKNGAHVHIHELLFFNSRVVTPQSADLLSHWQSACLSVGLAEPDSHGVDIRGGNEAGRYVGKWGLEYEMTKSHTKHGHGGGRTPFDLLRAAATGDAEAAELFREHARAFKGRRQLVWSRGLREKLGLDRDQTDQELVEAEEQVTKLGTLSYVQWALVLRNELRSEVLRVAAVAGWEAIQVFLDQYIEGPCVAPNEHSIPGEKPRKPHNKTTEKPRSNPT
jgi:hypothetical protein